jgi:ferritin
MLISKKLAQSFNRQIGNEFATSLQYTAIGAYFAAESLPELSKFFNAQAGEERDHAQKLLNYVVDMGGTASIPGLPAPKCAFKSALEAVQLALDSEMEVTRQINGLVDQAIKEADHQAQNFLQWFVNEQREEVTTMDFLVKLLKRAGTQLLYVEEYLARNGVPSAAGEAQAGA